MTDTYDYDAFGNLIHSSGTTPNEFLFAGEQFDADLGHYYNRARYLNPVTGRFITMDVLEGDPQSPISLHKYLYASADPVELVDPTGNQDFISIVLAIEIVLLGVYVGYLGFTTAYIVSQLPDLAGNIAIPWAQYATSLALLDIGSPNYQRLFGTPTAARMAHVLQCYEMISDSLTKPYTFHFTPQDVFAYTYQGGPLEIWLGRDYFAAPLIGRDSKAGTLIHETSHIVCFTDDHTYGYANAVALAASNPDLAIDNADNYEYFAEDEF